MEDDFLVRPMAEDDISQVLEIQRVCNPSPWSPRLFQAELKNPCSSVDLLFLEGQLAGFLCTWFVAGELEIQDIGTSPGFRRRGIAGKLLSLVLERCRKQGLEKTFLDVRIGNSGAIGFYERFGFRIICERRHYYSNGEDALVMERVE